MTSAGSATVSTSGSAPVELDGDRVAASTSMTVTVQPAALLVRVPR